MTAGCPRYLTEHGRSAHMLCSTLFLPYVTPPPLCGHRWLRNEALRAMDSGLFMRCPRDGCGEGVQMDQGDAHFVCPTCRWVRAACCLGKTSSMILITDTPACAVPIDLSHKRSVWCPSTLSCIVLPACHVMSAEWLSTSFPSGSTTAPVSYG